MVFIRQDIIGKTPIGQVAYLPIADASLTPLNTRPNGGEGFAMDSNYNPAGVGYRIAKLRSAYGLTKSAMADALGVDRTNFGRFEKGERSLPLEVGYKISQKYKVSMDWLYLGREDYLSFEMAERLRQAK